MHCLQYLKVPLWECQAFYELIMAFSLSLAETKNIQKLKKISILTKMKPLRLVGEKIDAEKWQEFPVLFDEQVEKHTEIQVVQSSQEKVTIT